VNDRDLNLPERDVIRLALRGDVDMRRYVPEVMGVCAKLNITEPPWMEDAEIRERVELNRPYFEDLRKRLWG
jgi:hypothetical protein